MQGVTKHDSDVTASTWAGLQVVTESEKSPLEWRPESTRHISRPTLGHTGTYRLCQANTPPHCPTQAARAQCYNYHRQLSAQTEGVSKVLSKQVFCSLCCTVSNPPAIGLCHLCKHSNILNNKLAIFSPLMFPMTVDCPVVRGR